jgi:hypothetical protein
MIIRLAALALIPALGLTASVGLAQELRPFAPVQNVCPTCDPDRFDRVQLKQGEQVRAWVIAENSAFHVLERHGEIRAVARGNVAEIKLSGKRNAKERDTIRQQHRDQILVKNGHLLSGRLLSSDNNEYRMESVGKRFTFVVSRDQAWMVVQDGKVTYTAKR